MQDWWIYWWMGEGYWLLVDRRWLVDILENKRRVGVTGSTTDILTAAFLQSGDDILNAVFNQTFIVGLVNNTLNLGLAYFIVTRISPRYLSKTNYGSKFIKPNKKVYDLDGEVK